MSKKVYITALIIFVIDQLSKAVASTYISLGKSVMIIKDFLYITYINNTGASWGILENKKYLLIIFSIIAILILIRYINSFKNTKLNILGLGFLLGGILGNLADRILFGYVRDFFDFYIFKYNFPIFNIADIFIVVGVLLTIISILRGEDKNGNSSRKK